MHGGYMKKFWKVLEDKFDDYSIKKKLIELMQHNQNWFFL